MKKTLLASIIILNILGSVNITIPDTNNEIYQTNIYRLDKDDVDC